jgi:hypothetical protein
VHTAPAEHVASVGVRTTIDEPLHSRRVAVICRKHEWRVAPDLDGRAEVVKVLHHFDIPTLCSIMHRRSLARSCIKHARSMFDQETHNW